MERFRDNYHEISDEEPLSEGTVNTIVESMKKYGFDKKKPIMIYEGKISDGRHRFIAAEFLNIEPIYEEFHGTYDEAMDYADAQNNARRHKSIAQRAVKAARLILMREDKRYDLKQELLLANPKMGINKLAVEIGKKYPILTAKVVAEKENVSKDYINQCLKYYREEAYDASTLCDMLMVNKLNMTQAKAKYKAAMDAIRESDRPPVHLDEDQEILLEKTSMAKEHPSAAAYEILMMVKREREYRSQIIDLENILITMKDNNDEVHARAMVAESALDNILNGEEGSA